MASEPMIDTSTAAVEEAAVTVHDWTGSLRLRDFLRALAAERDAAVARAERAEAEVARVRGLAEERSQALSEVSRLRALCDDVAENLHALASSDAAYHGGWGGMMSRLADRLRVAAQEVPRG